MVQPSDNLCGDNTGCRILPKNPFLNLGILQWQNSPHPGSANCDISFVDTKKSEKLKKNYILENIKRNCEPQRSVAHREKSIRGLHPCNQDERFRTFERFISDLSQREQQLPVSVDAILNEPQNNPRVKVSETGITDSSNNSTSTRTTFCNQPVPIEPINPNFDSETSKKFSKAEDLAPQYITGSPRVSVSGSQLSQGHSSFLRAHQKTGLSDEILQTLSSLPLKRIPKQAPPEKLSVPRADSARDMHLIRRSVNYVRANAHSVSGKFQTRRVPSCESLCLSNCTTTRNGRPMNSERTLQPGEIPAYLVRRRREEEKRRRDQLQMAANDVPDGHRLMPEEERLDTLQLLYQGHADVMDELGRLPISLGTMRVRERRADLESKLSDLENTIGIFKKPRVFVKLD